MSVPRSTLLGATESFTTMTGALTSLTHSTIRTIDQILYFLRGSRQGSVGGETMKREGKKSAAALTELEGCVLGMIALRGPCTPYAVRREFQESPSQYWSASAGAVYPLVVRMLRRRLVHAQRKPEEGRGAILYSLTAA